MPILSRHGVYVEIVGASGGVGGNGGGGGDMAAHAHGISDPGHNHGIWWGGGGGCAGGGTTGLEEFTSAVTQAIAQSMTMPPQVLKPPANYLACDNALVVRDIDQRFSWQTD
jgi:hypothetical protein